MADENQKIDDRIVKFKKALKDMIATTKGAYSKSNSKSVMERHYNYTKEEIRRIVSFGTPVEKAKLSTLFFNVSGLYKRIILHYATFLTYSWILVPHKKKSKDKISDKGISEQYYKASDFCSTFQIERRCALFSKEILIKGAYYGLIRQEGDFVAVQDLPFEYCRSRYKNLQEIDIIEFNVAFFDEQIRDDELRKEILQTYPKVIQKGYYNYKNKKKTNWIFIPAELGIYFNFFDENPFFLDLIPLLDDLDDYKDMDKERNLQSLKRILVQTVPTHDMKLVFEPDEAEEMHQGVIEMLRSNPDVDVITTYNKIDLLDLSSDNDDRTEIQDVQNIIYESAGISKELFAATTKEGLEFSLNNDLALCMMLGRKYANFFSALVNYRFNNKKIKFQFLILPISHYNSADYTSRAKELAAFGYSFLTPVLSTGVDQVSLTDLKELENELLDLDEILKPLQSSYTQSNKSTLNAISANASKIANAKEEGEEKLKLKKEIEKAEKEEKEKTEDKENGGEEE